MLLLGLLACSDFSLRKLEPELVVEVSSLDFEEVVVGTQRTAIFTLRNGGGGVLHIDGVTVVGSADFTLPEAAPDEIAPGDLGELAIRYTPDAIGPDDATADLLTDDPDSPTLELSLAGQGVEPIIDIDPETLWFGDVAPGDTSTLSFDVTARGKGDLYIDEIGLVDDAGEVFSAALPDGYAVPFKLEAGTGFTMEVSFSPTDETPWDGALYILSNDPTEPDARVRLLGNTEGMGTEAPTVEITWPDWGDQIVAGETVTLTGSVVDDADPPESLVALWYANDLVLGVSTPDTSGAVALSTAALPEGEVTLRLVAIDTGAMTGEDQVVFNVYDLLEPTPYTLTGGSTLWDYWTIDDDVIITLDGERVFVDSDLTQDTHPPVELDARPGQVLRIVASDVNACDQSLDALVLHWGAGRSQDLNEAWCRSSCPSHACYDPEFVGPWPNVFLDVEYTISIP